MTRLPILIALALLATGSVAAEEIYRTTDEDGTVVFTDDPPSDDAEPVELAPLTTVPSADAASDSGNASAATSPSGDKETEQPPAPGITGIAIAYPEQGKAIRHNGGNVPFRVKLQPEGATLPPGHQVQIVLDGKARARAASTRVTVSPVNRGPHIVRARVIDKAGRTRFESESVKFYLLRVSLGND